MIVITSAASLRAIRAISDELPESFMLKRPHRRIRPWGRIKRARHAAAPSKWFYWRGIASCDNGERLRAPRLSRFRPLRRKVGVWGICVVGGHAPRLTSRPERASDMHPQAPNTQTFLPAYSLSTACDYYGLNCFDPLVPPSAPERTLQASGQGQAIARPKGGPPAAPCLYLLRAGRRVVRVR